MKKTILFISIISLKSSIIFLLLLVIFLELIKINIKNEVIFTSCQPDNINYDSFGPYCVWLYKSNTILSKQYYFFIAKSNVSNYGYKIAYFNDLTRDENDIKNIIITWEEDYVKIQKQDSGTYIVVSSDDFAGGR